MRRIRRSAVGSPERENGARSAFCDSSLCATSGRTIKSAVANNRNHAQKQRVFLFFADLLASILLHLSEYLYFWSLSLLSGLWFGSRTLSGEVLKA